MKQIFLYFGIMSFLAMCLFSCRPQAEEVAVNQIDFDTIRTVRNYHIDNDSTQPSCNLKLTFVHPVSANEQLMLDSLQHIFVSCFFNESYDGLSAEQAVKSYEDNYVENYKEDVRIYARDREGEHDAKEIYSSYYEIDTNTIEFNKGGVLSFQVNQTNYKGGASSYESLRNYVVDVKTARLIMESDILNSGYEKALGVVLRDNLLKDKKVKSIEELENVGYFNLDEMIPNGNFLLDDKGITYVFNKGEYSGYKIEAIKIFVSYNDIRPLIKEGSLISKFVSL